MSDLLRVCKVWKKKKSCPNQEDGQLPSCWREDCNGHIHLGCSTLLLDFNKINVDQRPTHLDVTEGGDPIVFCTKTCFLKWRAHKNRVVEAAQKGVEVDKKTRVPWEEDGCIDVSLDWLTTEGDCAAYCGSSGNKGINKSACHKKIALLIKEKKPDSDRTEKSVENKIIKLERQCRDMVDWKNNTGAGLDDVGEIDACAKEKCPCFDVLDEAMGERPNTEPLLSNETDDDTDDDSSTLQNNNNETAVEQSTDDEPVGGGDDDGDDVSVGHEDAPPPKQAEESIAQGLASGKSGVTTTASVASKVSGGSSKRISATGSSRNNKRKKADDAILDLPGDDDDDEGEDDFKSFRKREAEAREKEASARMIEATAIREKATKETEILSIDKIDKPFRTRKSLLDDGTCAEEEPNKHVPMTGQVVVN